MPWAVTGQAFIVIIQYINWSINDPSKGCKEQEIQRFIAKVYQHGKFFVNGEKFPSSFGTGSEDYIGYAWAAEPPFPVFDSPFAMMDMPISGNGITSAARYHIPDDIPFQDGFEAFIEKYKPDFWENEGKCLYRVTAFCYMQACSDDGYPLYTGKWLRLHEAFLWTGVGFPFGQILEQPLVSPVRNDMIHYCNSFKMAGRFLPRGARHWLLNNESSCFSWTGKEKSPAALHRRSLAGKETMILL